MKDIELLKLLEDESQLVIFGYSLIGQYLYRLIKKERLNDIEIIFCDNSSSKQNENGECKVISVEAATKEYRNAAYIYTSASYREIMREQLQNLGIAAEQILDGVTDEALEYVRACNREKKYKPLTKLQFEVDLVTHCNLNCKCCSQFSPIAEESFIDPLEMEKDFARLSEIVGGEVERIFLIGGEPLLHPDIVSCMKIARKYFPKGTISVFTNGLLLANQKESFWSACKDYEIELISTKYPIALDYDRLKDIIKAHGVKYSFIGASSDFKYMKNLGLDVTGKQDIIKSFENCVESNNCIKLKDGRLYTCTRPAAIKQFNRYFGMNLEVSKEDYLDIYEEWTKDRLLETLAKPIPFCRYCNLSGCRHMEWGQTKKEIEEWTD